MALSHTMAAAAAATESDIFSLRRLRSFCVALSLSLSLSLPRAARPLSLSLGDFDVGPPAGK